jgi:hypothetical protein
MSTNKLSNVLSGLLGVAMCLYVASFPFSNKCSVISLWIFGGFAIIWLIVHRKLNWQWLYLFPIALLALRVGSWAFSTDLKFNRIEGYMSFLVVPVLVSFFKFNATQVQRCLRGLFYVLLASAVLGWVFYLRHIVCQHLFMESLQNPKQYVPLFLVPPLFNHASTISVVLAFIIPLGAYLRFRKCIPTWLQWVSVLATIPFIYFTGARIGLVASFILLVFAFIFYIKRFSVYERVAVLLLAVALVLFSKQLPYNAVGDPVRKNLRTLGMKAIAEHPLWGSGVGSMEGYITSTEFAAKHGLPAYAFNHFHCAPIDEVVQFGFIGSVVLLAFLVCIFILAWRRRDFLLFSFVLLYFPILLVESPFTSVKWIMPMMFWLCLLVGTQKERETVKCLG